MLQDRRAAMYKKGIAIAAVTLGALVAGGVARAEEPGTVPSHPMMSDRFFIGLGAFYPESNTQGTVNSGTVGIGTFIDFESDFGLDERKVVGQALFRWRMSYRWQLQAEYAKVDRDKETQISRSITIRNTTFPINGTVKTSFNFEDARVGVGYSFFRRPDKEVGLGLGVHVVKLETGFQTGSSGSESASTSAPLPTVTIYSNVALTDRWLMSVRLDRLSIGVQDIDGSVSSTGLDFIYQPWRHFNLGLGYRDIAMQVTSTGGNWRGNAQIQLHGPLLFIGTTF